MILGKTESGQQAFKDRTVALSPRQRSAFILFDGKRSLDDVLAAGMGVQREDIDQMVALGLLAPVGGTAVAPAAEAVKSVAPAAAAPAAVASGRTAQQRYKDAYPVATLLTGSLGLMGFRLNMQVEACGNYEDLVQLLPKIKAAVGPEKALLLERALKE